MQNSNHLRKRGSTLKSQRQNKMGEGDGAGGFSLIAGVLQAGFGTLGGMSGQCDPSDGAQVTG